MTRREKAIKKIASLLFSEEEYNNATNNNMQEKTAQKHTNNQLFEKCASASNMLKIAAQEIRSLKAENKKLAASVDELNNKLDTIERHDEAEKLAQIMVQKGMLKAADIDGKTIELMALDNEGFSIVKDAIENVSVEKKASFSGANSFDFMYDIDSSDYALSEGEDKPSMISAIQECIK